MTQEDIPRSIRQGDEWPPSGAMTPLERAIHILVAVCLLGFGLYAICYSPSQL